jgi:hypothetical protein
MDVVRFDALTRTLGAGASRRGGLGVVLAALGLGTLAPADGVAKTKTRKKAKPNAFGCLNRFLRRSYGWPGTARGAS